jgi:hypothetical protein
MAAKTIDVKATRVGADQSRTLETEPAGNSSVSAPEGHAFQPKQLSVKESILLTLKIGSVACAVMGLLWLASVKLDR